MAAFIRCSQPQIFARLVTLAWIGLLFYLASLSRLPQLPLGPESTTSPFAHFAAHLVLAGMVYLSTASGLTAPGKRVAVMAFAFAFSAVLALGLEGLQVLLPDRGAQASDALLDIAGAGTGVVATAILYSLKPDSSFLSITASGITSVLIIIGASSVFIWDPGLPRVGDHWHADYQISVCGRILPPLSRTHGGVHTHGEGVIHISPRKAHQAGRSATLVAFLEKSGGSLTEGALVLPTGKRYANEDYCPDGKPGQLVLRVNRNEIESITKYVLRDGNEVLLSFEPR